MKNKEPHKDTRHKVHFHFWESGILQKIVIMFETFEEALSHLLHSKAHSGKIYNASGHIVHHHSCPVPDTYA